MTIYEFLKQDHRAVKKLFKEAQENLPEDPSEAMRIFKIIKEELTSHAKAEEEVFYRPLKNGFNQKNQDLVLEGKEEHHVITLLLKELSQLDCHLPEWGAKLQVLGEIVEHHVEEEENDIFPEARKLFSLSEARQMATDMNALKEKYKSSVDAIIIKEIETFF